MGRSWEPTHSDFQSYYYGNIFLPVKWRGTLSFKCCMVIYFGKLNAFISIPLYHVPSIIVIVFITDIHLKLNVCRYYQSHTLHQALRESRRSSPLPSAWPCIRVRTEDTKLLFLWTFLPSIHVAIVQRYFEVCKMLASHRGLIWNDGSLLTWCALFLFGGGLSHVWGRRVCCGWSLTETALDQSTLFLTYSSSWDINGCHVYCYQAACRYLFWWF